MEIRRIRADEADAYREVRLRALRRAPDAFGATLAEEEAFPDATWTERAVTAAEAMEAACFVVDRGDGALAGTAYVRVSPDSPHDAYIGAMWVDEDLRGEGWAAELLATAERFARALGSRWAELWVEDANARGRAFYARAGYVPTGIDEPSRNGATTLLLGKELAPY